MSKITKMVYINYNNSELESLMREGISDLYKDVSGKRGFMKALLAFPYLLRFLHSTKDLQMYKQYDYKYSVNVSYVLIKGSNIQRKLLFSELKQGTSIIINELI